MTFLLGGVAMMKMCSREASNELWGVLPQTYGVFPSGAV